MDKQIKVYKFYKNTRYLEIRRYHKNSNQLKTHFYRINYKKEGEYKEFYINGLIRIYSFYKNDKRNGKYYYNYSNGTPFNQCFYINGKLDGEYKNFYENWQIYEHEYYINDEIIIHNFNFKIKFCLLKFKSILKKKIKKSRYKLLDKHFIPDINNIIISYLYL